MGYCNWPTSKALYVRFGSKADIGVRIRDVRFTPESGHAQRHIDIRPNTSNRMKLE
jgi:hypothetical protein